MASSSGSIGIAAGCAAPATTTALSSPPLGSVLESLVGIASVPKAPETLGKGDLVLHLSQPCPADLADVGRLRQPIVLNMSTPSTTMPRRSRSSPARRALIVITALVLALLVFVLAALAMIVACYDVRTVDLLPLDVSAGSGAARIPRIIHQTWKTAELPDRWRNVSESCRAMHPS